MPPGHLKGPHHFKLAPRERLARTLLAVSGLTALLGSCGGSNIQVDFGKAEVAPPAAAQLDSRPGTLRIAVAPILPPRPTSALYDRLATYVGAKLGRPVELIQGQTYAEINDMVKTGEVTLALVCPNPYLQGRDDFGMELIAAPQIHGDLTYFSYLLVDRNSSARSLGDLKGGSFAFTDPLSNTGRLAPLFHLALLGKNPDSFFSQTIFTYSHDGSIRAVADGVVAAAAVTSVVFDYLAANEPSLTDRVQVIERWGPFGLNPVVVNPRLDAGLKADLQRVFLGMDEDAEGLAILRNLTVDRFVVPEDRIYDSVREMRTYLRERGMVP